MRVGHHTRVVRVNKPFLQSNRAILSSDSGDIDAEEDKVNNFFFFFLRFYAFNDHTCI